MKNWTATSLQKEFERVAKDVESLHSVTTNLDEETKEKVFKAHRSTMNSLDSILMDAAIEGSNLEFTLEFLNRFQSIGIDLATVPLAKFEAAESTLDAYEVYRQKTAELLTQLRSELGCDEVAPSEKAKASKAPRKKKEAIELASREATLDSAA